MLRALTVEEFDKGYYAGSSELSFEIYAAAGNCFCCFELIENYFDC